MEDTVEQSRDDWKYRDGGEEEIVCSVVRRGLKMQRKHAMQQVFEKEDSEIGFVYMHI